MTQKLKDYLVYQCSNPACRSTFRLSGEHVVSTTELVRCPACLAGELRPQPINCSFEEAQRMLRFGKRQRQRMSTAEQNSFYRKPWVIGTAVIVLLSILLGFIAAVW